MPYFTDQPIGATDLSILDAPTDLSEAIGAGISQSFSTSITPLLVQEENLTQEEHGRKYYSRASGLQIQAPATPPLTKQQADEQVKEAGLELDIPESGIRQGALKLLMDRRRAEREREITLQNAPDGSAPAVLLAQFAAQAVDPINVASAFIPVFGEARYTAMLARAGSMAGRLGVRAGVGAAEGAVGAAILEPAVYTLSQRLQDDYDITDSLSNIAFGAALGGSLRGVGGMIADRIAPPNKLDLGDALDDLPTADRAVFEQNFPRKMEVPEVRMAPFVDDVQVKQMAIGNLMPAFRNELEEIAAGKLPNVRDIRNEVYELDKRISELPGTFKSRAKAFQSEGMGRKRAESEARKAIDNERIDLIARKTSAEDFLDKNRSAEIARGDLAAIERGEIPSRLASRIEAEQSRISQGFQQTKIAREIIPFADKSDLFHKTMGAVMNGHDISPSTFLDLKSPDPVVRQRAVDHIKNAPRRTPAEYVDASTRANRDIAETPKDDMAFQESQGKYDEDTAKEVAEQTGYNLKDDAELIEANKFAKEVEAYQAVYRANALCMLRG